jgi:tetratricopeptide (TPR) repeat protein
MHGEFFRRPAFHLVLIVLLGLLVYSNTFNVPFQFDDRDYMINNPAIKDFSYFLDPSRTYDLDYFFDVKRYLRTRIVAYLSFWANYRIGGRDVKGYHIVNTTIHIVNALLVYMIVHLTFKTPFLSGSYLKSHSGLIALFSGLLFVAHPIQTMAVTYILQRWASLAAMFYMLSVVLYVRWRLGSSVRSLIGVDSNRGSGVWRRITFSLFYALSLFSCILAMKTKELAFTLPLMIALYEFLFFTPPHAQRATGGIKNRQRALHLLPFFITMIIIPSSYLNLNISRGEFSTVLSEATKLESAPARLDYFLSQFGAIATYIRLLFMPVGQSVYHDDMLRHSFSEPSVFLPFIFLLCVLGLGVYLYYSSRIKNSEWWGANSNHRSSEIHASRVTRHALRFPAFGIFWFFLSLSVESSILPIMDVIFEYRVYLPSAGAFVAIVSGAFILATRFERARKAAAYAAAAAVLVLSGATYARNTIWQSEISLWEDTVKKAPDNPFGHYSLGKSYEAAGLREKAIGAYRDCIELQPDAAWAHVNLAAIYFLKGMADEAIEHYKPVLEFDPDSEGVHNNIGAAYFAKGMTEEAIEYYKEALKLNPSFAEARINLGSAYVAKGLMEKAEEQYSTAVKLKSYSAHTYFDIGSAYLKLGYTDRAIENFEAALELNPEDALTHNTLGAAYQSNGMDDKAVEHYRTVAQLEPSNPMSYYNLGIIYQSRGLMDNAIQLYQIALEVAPNYAEAHSNLGVAYQSKGMADKAIEHYRTALELKPYRAEAHFNLGLVYFQQGLAEKAREEFEEALKIDPGYSKARESLDRLDEKQQM